MSLLSLSSLPAVDPARVPSHSTYDPTMDAHFHTGQNAIDAVDGLRGASPRPVGLDIETAGLGAAAFHIKCVTAAWVADDGTTHSVLLDPRDTEQAERVRFLTGRAASTLVLHNAPYDWPVLYNYGLVELEYTAKVWDTKVAASMAFPDKTISKSLVNLVQHEKLLDLKANDSSMAAAFSAAGYRTQGDGWRDMDISSGVYRLGAMADTVLTLRLAGPLYDAVISWTTANTFVDVSADWAAHLLEREQNTNRIMLRVSARGLRVDTEYLGKYTEEHTQAREEAAAALVEVGLDPDAGNLGAKLVEYLAQRGELPSDWPITPGGKPKADKGAIALLEDHPLAQSQRVVARMSKVSGYLEKVDRYADLTGRIHPQVGILGASATGRMAYSEPELQQFPAGARPILVPEPGHNWTSIDWSSIEPVIVANCAGDDDFLRGFNESGADLYAPIVAHAGVERKVAKVVLLAAMYGQGRALLASTLGTSEDEAAAVQERVFSAMPATRQFLDGLRSAGDSHGAIMTADYRHLSVPSDPAGRVMGYKATNYFVQGSAYSVLSDAINRIEAAGMGDAIALAMHDELVVDSEAAHDIRQIMETPPAWLNDFAQRTVVLRTDANVLNGHWEYV